MKKAKLLWIDLEMTGLEPDKDRILEVAAIATDMKLAEIARFEAVVKVDEALIKERMVGKFWEENSTSRDALISQNSSGKPVAEVEKELIKFVEDNFGKEVYLAGNSIHQDRKFIEREMPKFNQLLHYRMLDVSAWKIYFENALGKKFIKPENHRALDDVTGSIEELKWYLTFLK
ncbi:oligoribonuclease [Candidatus Saccharibacteria bacterium]|nr:oligoribonuclease [Candidatus Saccharibacteria bacterium]